MTNYQSRFSAQGQGKLQPAPPLVFVERMERAFPPLPSFPPPQVPKHPSSGNPGRRSTPRSSPTPPPAPPPAPPVNVPKQKPSPRTPGRSKDKSSLFALQEQGQSQPKQILTETQRWRSRKLLRQLSQGVPAFRVTVRAIAELIAIGRAALTMKIERF